ncbi:MAG: cytosolic protein [Candidatus Aenigmarchaeota archaeon]|nr:cytosolic protein [Candidatus Aenigmarchaeota archaeon]
MNIKNILKQSIDLHVHIGPEIIPRKFTAATLAKEEEGKLKGVGIKSHFFPTVPFVREAGKTKLEMIGSVTLNNYLGGLNPDVVKASAELSKTPIIVWFPTISSENFLSKSEYEIRPEWADRNLKARPSSIVKGISVMENGKLSEDAIQVLKIIKEYGCILATGHISPEESEALVKEAGKLSIDKIIVTHPIYQLINMSKEKQKELAELGAFIEVSASMYYIDKISMEKIVQQIKFVGPENCILTSDSGQEFSQSPSKVLEGFMNRLVDNGIIEKELMQMLIYNPAKLLS